MAKAVIKKAEHKATPFAVTDFETGGLDPVKCAVTEIAMVVVQGDTFEEIGRYESLIQPYNNQLEYAPQALQITGITMEALHTKGNPITEVAKKVIELLDYAKQSFGDGKSHKPVFVAHNSSFDVGFLQHLMHYGGQSAALTKLLQGKNDFHGNFMPLSLDTIVLAKMMWGADIRMANYKLETCVNRMGIELNDAHRAMNDILATKDFMVNIVKAMRSGENGGGSLAAAQQISSRKHFQF